MQSLHHLCSKQELSAQSRPEVEIFVFCFGLFVGFGDNKINSKFSAKLKLSLVFINRALII